MHFPGRILPQTVLLAMLLSLSLLADVSALEKQNRIALVLGNSEYVSARLANPTNDAEAIAAVLRRLGFDVILKTNATRREMRESIRAFSDKLSRNQGAAVFFFAGHGVQYDGANYLIPIGADIRNDYEVEYEAVNASEILAAMKHSGNPTNIMILDACRNNPFARSFRSASNGLAKMDAPPGSLVAFSTAAGSVAQDGPPGGNSIYTKHLLANIEEPGLSAVEVFMRVRQGVAAETGQVPLEENSLLQDFKFNPGTSPTTGPVVASLPSSGGVGASAASLEIEFWQSIKGSSSADEYQAFLNSFPNSRFAPLARLWLRRNVGAARPQPPPQPTPATSAPPWPSVATPAPSWPTPVASAPPWPSATAPPTAVNQPPAYPPGDAVAGALQRADQAFAAKRLSTPPSDSAIFWSGRVLEMDPGNQRARAIRRDIVASYLRWGQARLAKGRYDGARSYLRRAQSIESFATESQRREIRALEASLVDARKTAAVPAQAAKAPVTGDAVGGIVVVSEPAGAEVYVARKLLGVTPLQSELAVGHVRLVLKKAGFKDRAYHVEITAGAEKRVNLSLQSASDGLGSLSIVTEPPGVVWFLDGARKGTTPAVLKGVSAGKHELRLESKGRLGRRHTVSVSGGEQTLVDIVVDRRRH